MISQDLLSKALKRATEEQFCFLFGVLMKDTTGEGLKRFQNGVGKLIETEKAVAELLRIGDQGTQMKGTAP